MRPNRTHPWPWTLLASGCAALTVAIAFLPGPARAQPRGQVVLTQKAPPTGITEGQIARFIRKHRTATLQQTPGKQSWHTHMFVHLRQAPAAGLLNLPANRGQLHLAFYRWHKRRWVRDNVDDIAYRPGATILRFPYRISGSLGLTAGARYQVRVTVLNRYNREVILATGYFTLKAAAKPAAAK